MRAGRIPSASTSASCEEAPMTEPERAELEVLKLANPQGKFALEMGHTPSPEFQRALERLQLRRWVSRVRRGDRLAPRARARAGSGTWEIQTRDPTSSLTPAQRGAVAITG